MFPLTFRRTLKGNTTLFDTDGQGAHVAPCGLRQAQKKGRCKGNDDTERKGQDAHSDRAGERPQTEGMEGKGAAGMTWAAMKVDPAETSRRQGVVVRLNLLWHKRNTTEDTGKRKRIDREISRIRANESSWLKPVAYWLY